MNLPPKLPGPRLTPARQVCELTHLTYRELSYALDRGWLTADRPAGTATWRRFLFDDQALRRALIFACLRRAGIAADVAAHLSRAVGNRPRSAPPASAHVQIAPGVTITVDETQLVPTPEPKRPGW